jgi:amidase
MSVPHDPALLYPLSIGDGRWRVLIKDSIDIAGHSTRQASAIFADAPPAAAHAEVVAQLLASGQWSVVGKANMHELAFGVTGVNLHTGTPVNPFWPERIPGGSSSGSASGVASGLADLALGTDTGGSVRLPAACCGVVGFKPGFGLVSRRGVHPAESSLDCVGVFARSVAVVQRAMASLAPAAWGDASPIWTDRPRLGVVSTDASPAILKACDEALVQCQAGLEPVTLDGLDEAFIASITLMAAENWQAFGRWADHPALGEDVRTRLKAGQHHNMGDIAQAREVGRRFAARVDAALAGVDALVMPTLPIVPPTLIEAVDATACVPLTRLVRPFNLSGHPAITLPLRTQDGLPVGLQLIGRRDEDAALCAVARRIAVDLGLESAEEPIVPEVTVS